MRKKGLITLFVIFVLISIFMVIITDEWIEGQLENTLSGMVGARVEFDGFYVSVFKLEAGWKGFRVTDPNDTWKNIIETGRAACDLEVVPVIYGRLVVDELRLEDVRSGTQRASDGKLPDDRNTRRTQRGAYEIAAAHMSGRAEDTTIPDLSQLSTGIDIENVVKSLNLTTIDNLSGVRDDIDSTAKELEQVWNSFPEIKERSEAIIAEAQTIDINNLRQIDDFIRTANTIKSIRDRSESLQTDIFDKKTMLSEGVSRFERGLETVDNWIQDDIRRARAAARLPEINAENIAGMLFGQQLLSRVQSALRYLDIAHEYSAKLAPAGKIESPPRFKGQDILFPDKRQLPRVWVKKIVLTGESGKSQSDRGIMLSGNAVDITSNQKIIGKPTVIQIHGGKEGGRDYRLGIVLDYLQDLSEETFEIGITRISLNNTSLGTVSMLPERIVRGSMDLSAVVSLKGNRLDGSVHLTAREVEFQFDANPQAGIVQEITRAVFESVDSLEIDFRFSGQPETLSFTVGSNIDRLYSTRLRAVVGDRLQKEQAALESRVRQKIEPEYRAVQTFITAKTNDIGLKINSLDTLLRENSQVVEHYKRSFEQRIDNEKNPLLRQALQRVRDIIK
ncbi:TIGR03545 family protein [candidate division KSB1 bacterium]